MDEPATPPVLDYGKPQVRRPSFLVALFFCLPGAVCWIQFLMESLLGVNTGFDSGWSGLVWIIAVITAIRSVFYYAFRWRYLSAWYVIVSLVINVAGWLFCAVMMIPW